MPHTILALAAAALPLLQATHDSSEARRASATAAPLVMQDAAPDTGRARALVPIGQPAGVVPARLGFAPVTPVAVMPVAVMRAPAALPAALVAPADTPVTRRPRAIEYSDWYYRRLLAHRIGAFAMFPLVGAELALGQNLINDSHPPEWIRSAHGATAGAIAVVFGVNTLTGLWNLWDARDDPHGRTRRIAHSALMLAADGGFLLTAALAPDEENEGGFVTPAPTRRHDAAVHRGVAIGSAGLAAAGAVMMWIWRE